MSMLAVEIERQQSGALETWVDPAAPPFNSPDSGPKNDTLVEIDPARSLVLAFRTITDQSRIQALINRYEARCDRQYHRALAALRAHRADRRREAAEATKDDSEKNGSETK